MVDPPWPRTGVFPNLLLPVFDLLVLFSRIASIASETPPTDLLAGVVEHCRGDLHADTHVGTTANQIAIAIAKLRVGQKFFESTECRPSRTCKLSDSRWREKDLFASDTVL